MAYRGPIEGAGYWRRVLWELAHRENDSCFFAFTELHCKDELDMVAEPVAPYQTEIEASNIDFIKRTRFYLGPGFGDLYLTRREGDCVAQMMRGLTAKRIGEVLDLSKRSVEYYLDNVRNKLDCRSRKELMKVIENSDFLANYYDAHDETF